MLLCFRLVSSFLDSANVCESIDDCCIEVCRIVFQLRQVVSMLVRVGGASRCGLGGASFSVMDLIQSKETEFWFLIPLKYNFLRLYCLSFAGEHENPASVVLVMLLQRESLVSQLLSKRLHLHYWKLLHHEKSILHGLNVQISLTPG